jgi:hypothetical protein
VYEEVERRIHTLYMTQKAKHKTTDNLVLSEPIYSALRRAVLGLEEALNTGKQITSYQGMTIVCLDRDDDLILIG